jgi:FkbM family methyltransferase
VAAFLRERVKPGDVCIDAGANVGLYALQFAHWSAPSGRIIAFEPNPTARRALEKHVRFNGLTERVRTVAAAIGASRGEVTLYAPRANALSRLGAPNPYIEDAIETIPVPVVTLHEFCQSESVVPDWLLMDIEGFEIAALEGAKKLIQSRAGKLGIVVEMHPNVWTSSGTSREKTERLLSELQLRPVPLTGQQDPLGEYGVVSLEFERRTS